MEPTTEEDAEHYSDAERKRDYDDDDDLAAGIKIVHQSAKSRQVQAIQTGVYQTYRAVALTACSRICSSAPAGSGDRT